MCLAAHSSAGDHILQVCLSLASPSEGPCLLSPLPVVFNQEQLCLQGTLDNIWRYFLLSRLVEGRSVGATSAQWLQVKDACCSTSGGAQTAPSKKYLVPNAIVQTSHGPHQKETPTSRSCQSSCAQRRAWPLSCGCHKSHCPECPLAVAKRPLRSFLQDTQCIGWS